jgi:hypothetical protein
MTRHRRYSDFKDLEALSYVPLDRLEKDNPLFARADAAEESYKSVMSLPGTAGILGGKTPLARVLTRSAERSSRVIAKCRQQFLIRRTSTLIH